MTSTRTARGPFRNLSVDLPRAIGAYFGDEYQVSDFEVECRTGVSIELLIEQVWQHYEPFIEANALQDKSIPELSNIVAGLTDTEFAKRTVEWVADGVPAVVLAVTNPQDLLHEYHLIDGQRRLALASALGQGEIATIIAKKI
ncbi:MAG: hypothetical protein JRC77_04245 [Deltaproteobacteria bacterium]|nr:hypothetical protein [Deltaproteobacteria bacterium]